ncbi:MAG: hypothetical protein K8R79_01370, partial [Calditrichales bacterium]|nr:hypothetical protein [Calditrichales bacterium]
SPASAGYVGAEIENEPEHISGNGSGNVEVSILFPGEIPENSHYQIVFSDTIIKENNFYSFETYAYSVKNFDDNTTVVHNSEHIGKDDIYPVFDGMGISVDNAEIQFLSHLSGLQTGQSDFTVSAVPDTGASGATAGLGGIFPFDYSITFSASIVDTSIGADIGLDEIPVNFIVQNTEDNSQVDFIFLDHDNNTTLTSGDEIIPVTPLDYSLSPTGYAATWVIKFEGSGTPPQPDDVFKVVFSNPFSSNDVFQFKTIQSAKVDEAKLKKDLDKIAVVPNPYILTNILEPRNTNNSGRGERVITFIHLPQKCTIRIFNLRGQLVDVLEHNGSQTDGVEKWDLVSEDGIDIAYGVYIFHVNAHGLGEKIGRFAVIK